MTLHTHFYRNINAFCNFIVSSGIQVQDPNRFPGWTTTRALKEMRTLGGMGVDWRWMRSMIEEADKRVDATFERPRREWLEAHMGAYPIVPDVLRGYPLPMRQLSVAGLDQSPLRIVLDCTAASGVPGNLLFKRGLTIAALVLRLMETRPVQVEAGYGVHVDKAIPFLANQMILVAMDPANLMKEVAFMVGGDCFTRIMGQQAAVIHARASIDSGLGWLWSSEEQGEGYAQRIRAAMRLGHDDLYIPPASYWDIEQLHANPGGWLRRAMDKQK